MRGREAWGARFVSSTGRRAHRSRDASFGGVHEMRGMRVAFAALLAGLALVPATGPFAHAASQTPESRAEAIVAQMTLDQKISQVHGVGLMNADGMRHIDPIPALGIPGLYITNGPNGVANG